MTLCTFGSYEGFSTDNATKYVVDFLYRHVSHADERFQFLTEYVSSSFRIVAHWEDIERYGLNILYYAWKLPSGSIRYVLHWACGDEIFEYRTGMMESPLYFVKDCEDAFKELQGCTTEGWLEDRMIELRNKVTLEFGLTEQSINRVKRESLLEALLKQHQQALSTTNVRDIDQLWLISKQLFDWADMLRSEKERENG